MQVSGHKGRCMLEFDLDSLEHHHTISGLCQIYHMVSGVAPARVCELLPPYDAKNRDSQHTENSHHFQLTINTYRTTSHMCSFILYYVKWNEFQWIAFMVSIGILLACKFSKSVLTTGALCLSI